MNQSRRLIHQPWCRHRKLLLPRNQNHMWLSALGPPELAPNHGRRFLATKRPQSTTRNASRFRDNKHLQRARLKGELKPMLSLAIHSFLMKKQERMRMDQQDTQQRHNYYLEAIDLLARWNGYQSLDPSRLVIEKYCHAGRLNLGQGLVAEPSAFVSEGYIVLARTTKQPGLENHPPFVEEDYSWYRNLELRVEDNLNRWEENARKRRQLRLQSAKQGLQRLLDSVQAPLARTFGAVTARVGPAVDQIRTTARSQLQQVNLNPLKQNIDSSHPGEVIPDEDIPSSQNNETENRILPTNNSATLTNETDPEDLIILTKNGETLMLLKDVHPSDRLLALPVVNTASTTRGSKVKPPYRLRLARGGLVITVSIVMLGAIPPTYRSLKWILEYPKTAEVVMISLVASVAYNLYSWHSNARTRQRELIAAAIQSRFVAQNEAVLTFLTAGAVETLTVVLMEEYVSRLLAADVQSQPLDELDPLVVEIGESVGLLQRPRKHKLRSGSSPPADLQSEDTLVIQAVEWDKARRALVSSIATRM